MISHRGTDFTRVKFFPGVGENSQQWDISGQWAEVGKRYFYSYLLYCLGHFGKEVGYFAGNRQSGWHFMGMRMFAWIQGVAGMLMVCGVSAQVVLPASLRNMVNRPTGGGALEA